MIYLFLLVLFSTYLFITFIFKENTLINAFLIIMNKSKIQRTASTRDLFDAKVPSDICISIVVLGASGDLAKKKTFPALFALFNKG